MPSGDSGRPRPLFSFLVRLEKQFVLEGERAYDDDVLSCGQPACNCHPLLCPLAHDDINAMIGTGIAFIGDEHEILSVICA